MLIETLLVHVAQEIADSVIDNLASDVQEKVKALLTGDPAKRAFQKALGTAVTHYAKGERLKYAHALTRDGGLLQAKEVTSELGKLISPVGLRPDTVLIGGYWRDALDNPPAGVDFTDEADLFVSLLESSLKATDVFREFFVSRNLDRIASHTDISAASLEALGHQVRNINELLEKGFATFLKQQAACSPAIRDHIIDFSSHIEEKTRGFVGRKNIFDALHGFVASCPRGYFIIRGDPGIGKTALASQLVKEHGYIHFFNIRSDGVNRSSDFLNSVCAQLIARFNLPYPGLPEATGYNNDFLKKLLHIVSQQLDGKKCLVIVDALDEADLSGMPPGANPLFLPSVVPVGVYIIVTMRHDIASTGTLRIDMPEQHVVEIAQDAPENVNDIQDYLRVQLTNPGILAFIRRNRIDGDYFIQAMTRQSQGNFIYLRHILPEIESGHYKDVEIEKIPYGLANYYEDHWRRIKLRSTADWFEWRLPVVVALTVVKRPISVSLIMEYSNVNWRRRVVDVLNDFDQFLYKTEVDYDMKTTLCYRWYHSSFFDFVAQKSEIKDELVDLQSASEKIAGKMLSDLYGGRNS